MAIIMRIINNRIVKLEINGHATPKLKGRPRRKRKKRSVSPGESSNESEASVASSAAASTSKGSSSSQSGQSILAPGNANTAGNGTTQGAASSSASSSSSSSSVVRRSERKTSAEEKKFVSDVQSFMTSRNTPLGKMPLLGYRQIDLFLFYTKVQDLGGYDRVSANRLWKSIYDEMGGNTGSTSAATITRRHYERLLLPYERCQKGEDSKLKPNNAGRRIKTPSLSDVSEDSVEVKRENETPPPSDTSSPTAETANSTIVTPPPLQSILSTSPFLPGEKPRSENAGKTSSLRSVRVKPERLKSLNTIIATSNPPPASQQQQLPSSPSPLMSSSTTTSTSSATTTSTTTPAATTTTATTTSSSSISSLASSGATSSSSAASSPTSTPPISTTPTNAAQHSVLERQLNSPLVTQQVPPSCSPPGLPVSTVATNATTVVTLTPPPEKDMKEIKLDPKQTSLLAQGKENIPLFEEKSPIFVDKPMVAPRSPEVIDLETENESGTRDKLIIPSFKKRKLEILREGGLEVTAVELDTRPSVIQPTTTTVGAPYTASTTTITTSSTMSSSSTTASSIPLVTPTIASTLPMKPDDKPPSFALPPSSVIPKLINVTVTPDISHMLPRPEDNRSTPASPIRQHHPVTPVKHQPQHQQSPTNHSSNGSPTSQASSLVNSRIINLGNSNNATLLQLYANANVPMPHSLSAAQVNHRFVPPAPLPAPVPNGRSMPPKVTQSRSIFGNNEKMVYGNPKDILVAPKYMPPVVPQLHAPRNSSVLTAPPVLQRCGNMSNDHLPGDVLDLTQKQSAPITERPTYGRPNLEIVRVPVVPRPNPLNLETRNFEAHHHRRSSIGVANLCKEANGKPPPDPTAARKNQFITGSVAPNPTTAVPGYANVLDSRTMATNNLEITLVSPKKSSGSNVGVPHSSPPTRNNNVIPPALPVQRRQQHQPQHQHHQHPQQQQQPPPQHHLNGKFPSRLPSEPVSPYTPRKPSISSGSSAGNSHHPVIPNVPNLSHLNASAAASYAKANQASNYQHLAMERRKIPAEIAVSREQQRRISEGDKVSLQQQQQRLESGMATSSLKQQQSRESEATSRRHSVPSLPTGFIPNIPPNSPAFLAHQLAAANNGSPAPSSPAAAAAAAAAAAGKFLPILDPLYYSAFYNGLFPGHIAPNTAATPYLPPELSAYYKELLASSSAQQTRLGQPQHQPAAPTSK